MSYDAESRYQFQPWYVKAYRRLRYEPIAFIVFAYRFTWWLAQGCPCVEWKDESTGETFSDTRQTTYELLVGCWRGDVDIAMGHLYTMDEAVEYLRE